MRGCITLTTDFGLRDPFVAVMKGMILRRAPQTAIVDVTHDIGPFRPAEAGFWLAQLPPYFPDRTVHLAVVDPGVGTTRGLLAVSCSSQLFLAPDNGLLAAIAARPGAVARRVEPATFEAIGAGARGATFHGRDLLAPLAAELVTGRLPFEALGELCIPVEGLAPPAARRAEHGWDGVVVTVDRFGNLLTNIEAATLDPRRDWYALVAGHEARHAKAYGEVPRGTLLALVNAWGLVEIAESAGHAASGLGVGRGEPVLLRYREDG
ncbi:MAG TPA: SAM-dependent chlorinase/fluorinase [Steroidobacteraceae bacterium]|nr:SAM-dependent chlorinase/fluorinase [Steroidobacteraceae bacterium]